MVSYYIYGSMVCSIELHCLPPYRWIYIRSHTGYVHSQLGSYPWSHTIGQVIYRLRLCRRPRVFAYSFSWYMEFGTICNVPLHSNRNSECKSFVKVSFRRFQCSSCFLQYGMSQIMTFCYRWLHTAPYGCIQMHTDAYETFLFDFH